MGKVELGVHMHVGVGKSESHGRQDIRDQNREMFGCTTRIGENAACGGIPGVIRGGFDAGGGDGEGGGGVAVCHPRKHDGNGGGEGDALGVRVWEGGAAPEEGW